MTNSDFITCQIRLENNIVLTVKVGHENDIIKQLKNTLYHARIYSHPDIMAAELSKSFMTLAIGKQQGEREIFVDIDAVDQVLSISKNISENGEICVYADTFKGFLKKRKQEIKAEWNKTLKEARKSILERGDY